MYFMQILVLLLTEWTQGLYMARLFIQLLITWRHSCQGHMSSSPSFRTNLCRDTWIPYGQVKVRLMLMLLGGVAL